jgi:exonuclease III
LKQTPVSLHKKNVNNNNGKKAKIKSSCGGQEGRTILILNKREEKLSKRHILKRNKGRKNDLKLYLKKRLFKRLKKLKLFKLFPVLIKVLKFFSQYKLVNKMTNKCYRAIPAKNIRRKWLETSSNFLEKIKINIKLFPKNSLDEETNRILLIRGNVEKNPGPTNQKSTKTQLRNKFMDVVTYNCNGLAVRNKRERVLRKANKITNAGGIVMLQETHIMKDEQVSSTFKDSYQLNPHKTNSAGVITLFSKDFEVIHTFKDNVGRTLINLVQRDEVKYLLVNVYCPNDHKASLVFIEGIYSKILEITYEHPDCHVILGGDFNSCLTELDYLNRNKTKCEIVLTKVIQQNNSMCGLLDSYRKLNSDPGYTWSRGECYSRLDYIYVSDTLSDNIKSFTINWNFDKSDHAALTISIRLKDEIKKGPGITKVNLDILKCPKKVALIRDELIYLLNQIPLEWNGHTKLEYLKMTLRSTISKYTGLVRAEDRLEVEQLETKLNDIEKQKIRLIRNKDNLLEENFNKILGNINKDKVENCNRLELLRNKLDKQQFFDAKAKWYEYGEKPNKFFLNLNKFTNKQKLIDEINNGPIKYSGNDKVREGIRDFYKDLYAAQDSNLSMNDDEEFYDQCPRLSDTNKVKMEEEISLEEMYKALRTCKDSSPGPDGIPYSVYKVFWPQIGIILKEAWDYSLLIGSTPESHKESVITILPKEGKDLTDIKNWRPITLTNCDAKIITKALALRLNPILESVIDPSQTAYVPGRSVMDNIRANKFVANYCETNKIEAVLASLDARKAFDSVNHAYIDKVLEKYGFGIVFRTYFKTLYKDLTARILVNGYMSEKINIERGVKQGDALSCAIFILCIDPLIRNINNNKSIKPVEIRKNTNKLKGQHKACGFADDISVACMNDRKSVSQIFVEYQRLTNKSGLTLNADKTEILNLNSASQTISFKVNYNQQEINLKPVDSLKICGIYYCNNQEEEHEKNVIDKIAKLRDRLRVWQSRHLTLEGKSLILKTFGISQLIYNMQCVQFTPIDLKHIEQHIFNFLWGSKNLNESRARDRIKRSVMKNEFKEGGLNITDIDCMNKSLKLRQYIRSDSSSHTINEIQKYCSRNIMSPNVMAQEFKEVTSEEHVCNIAQETLNIIVDHTRSEMFAEHDHQEITSSIAITQIAMTNTETFLKRRDRIFLTCINKAFLKEGLVTYLDLVSEAETERDRDRLKRLESIISAFPKYFRNAANSFNEDINMKSESITHILKGDSSWVSIGEVTTKELQWILKKAMYKVETVNLDEKLQIKPNTIDFVQFRQECRNPKLRNIYFRMIHNDFYTYNRMFKYNMTNSPNCPRCARPESTKHLLWDCPESQKIWNSYNDLLKLMHLDKAKLTCYDDVYRMEENGVLTTIKIRLVQEFIQIIRPTNWNIHRTKTIVRQLRMMEHKYGEVKSLDKVKNRWKILEKLEDDESTD